MIPATVHAALFTLILALLQSLVQWLAATVGIDLTGNILEQLATLIVGYILSLGGLALFRRANARQGAVNAFDEYHPPFT